MNHAMFLLLSFIKYDYIAILLQAVDVFGSTLTPTAIVVQLFSNN